MNRFARLSARAGGILLGFLLLSSTAPAQVWTGKARIEGRVVNERGEPVNGAVVKLTLGKDGGPEIKADKGGHWAYLGLTAGSWDVDVSAPGYETRKTLVQLSAINRIPPMIIKLTVEAPRQSAAPDIPKSVAPDVIPILQKGNELLEARDYAGARAQYEKALEIVPDNPAILRGIARAQYGQQKKDETIATLKRVLEKEPGDTDTTLLLANIQIEQGQLAEGKATLARVPPGAVKDPAVYVNLGVILLNRKLVQEAWEEFDKAVKLKPDDADSYFYRGLAAYQAKRKPEAKADFARYLELAPEGDQAKDARELLKSIK